MTTLPFPLGINAVKISVLMLTSLWFAPGSAGIPACFVERKAKVE